MMPRVKRAIKHEVTTVSLVSVVGVIALVGCLVLLIPVLIVFHRTDVQNKRLSEQISRLEAVAAQNRILARQGAQAHAVQCVSKQATIARRDAAQKYLDDVRSHVRERIPGTTDQDIIGSIRRDQDLLDAFDKAGLICAKQKPKT